MLIVATYLNVLLFSRGTIMNRDQVMGRCYETLGNLKAIVGKITDNKCLEIKGVTQKISIKVKLILVT
jgi:uncharacterized protein YjbJ (UPF0337 family)